MRYCVNCGTAIRENVKFCYKCGYKVENVEVEKKKEEKKKNNYNISSTEKYHSVQFTIEGNVIEYSGALVIYNKLRTEFMNNATDKSRSFYHWYQREVNSFEDIFDKAITQINNHIKSTIDFGVKVLRRYEINDIFKEELLELVAPILEEDTDKYIKPLSEAYDRIAEYANDLNEYRQASRASRSQWVGGGFGVKGAIKGALTAGAMNLGTNMLRGIGDLAVDGSDKYKIANMKKKVFQDQGMKDSLVYGVYECCFDIFISVYEIIATRKGLENLNFDARREVEIAEGYISRYKKSGASKNKAIEAACNCIRKNPYEIQFYWKLYDLMRSSRKAIVKMAKYFEVDFEVEESIKDIDNVRLEEINNIPDSTLPEIEEKVHILNTMIVDMPKYDFELNNKRNQLMQKKSEIIAATEKAEAERKEKERKEQERKAYISETLNLTKKWFEEKNWSNVEMCANAVLKVDADCIEAYRYKLLAEFKVTEESDLKVYSDELEESDNYINILRRENSVIKEKWASYCGKKPDDIYVGETKNEYAERVYREVKALIEKANGVEFYKLILDKLKEIPGYPEYKDTREIADTFYEKIYKMGVAEISNNKKLAWSILENIYEYKDSERIVNDSKESVYLEAKELSNTRDLDKLSAAVEKFNQILSYKDAGDLRDITKQKISKINGCKNFLAGAIVIAALVSVIALCILGLRSCITNYKEGGNAKKATDSTLGSILIENYDNYLKVADYKAIKANVESEKIFNSEQEKYDMIMNKVMEASTLEGIPESEYNYLEGKIAKVMALEAENLGYSSAEEYFSDNIKSQYGFDSFDEYIAAYTNDYLVGKMLLVQIAKEENIEVSEAELASYISNIKQSNGDSYVKNKTALGDFCDELIEYSILEGKVYNFFVEESGVSVPVVEVETTTEIETTPKIEQETTSKAELETTTPRPTEAPTTTVEETTTKEKYIQVNKVELNKDKIEGVQYVTGYEFSKNEIKCKAGDTVKFTLSRKGTDITVKQVQLTASIYPENATNKKITWKSDDESIAKVDKNGLVTVLKSGSCYIYAISENNIQAKCYVNIDYDPLWPEITEAVVDSNGWMKVDRNVNRDIDFSVYVNHGSESSITSIYDNKYTGKQSTSVVKIFSEYPLVDATKVELNITEMYSVEYVTGYEFSTNEIHCKYGDEIEFSLNKGDTDFTVKEFQLNATVYPENATDKTVTWGSYNEHVAKVDENGKVTIVGRGSTSVYAITENGKMASCYIDVGYDEQRPTTEKKGEMVVHSLTTGEYVVYVYHKSVSSLSSIFNNKYTGEQSISTITIYSE